jgi:hypothetical protein
VVCVMLSASQLTRLFIAPAISKANYYLHKVVFAFGRFRVSIPSIRLLFSRVLAVTLNFNSF